MNGNVTHLEMIVKAVWLMCLDGAAERRQLSLLHNFNFCLHNCLHSTLYTLHKQTGIHHIALTSKRTSQDTTNTMSRLPSPPSEEENVRPRSRALDPVPLNASIRTTPIHPQLPEIRVPQNETIPSTHYHPVTCEPLNIEEIQPQLQHLRREHPSITAMLKAREDAVKEIRQKLKEKDKKRDEVQKALDKKVKEWDVEYKILSKYQASKT